MSDVTRDQIIACIEQLDEAIAAEDPCSVPAPDFVEAMSDRQVCEWDKAIYELALAGLEAEPKLLESWGAAYSAADWCGAAEKERDEARSTIARAVDRLMPALVELDRSGKLEAGFVRQQVVEALRALGVDLSGIPGGG